MSLAGSLINATWVRKTVTVRVYQFNTDTLVFPARTPISEPGKLSIGHMVGTVPYMENPNYLYYNCEHALCILITTKQSCG